jgi:hypothetical protein
MTKPCGLCGMVPTSDCDCFTAAEVIYCQGCGAAPHIDGSHCGPTCPVQNYPKKDNAVEAPVTE